MAAVIRGRLEGAEELAATLRGLTKTNGRFNRALTGGVKKAARILTRAAKARAPKGPTKQLWRSLGAKVKVYSRGTVVGIVGARKDDFRKVVDGIPVDPARYAHLSEGGRKAIGRKGKVLTGLGREGKRAWFGKSVAAAPAQRWLRGAWQASKKAAEQALADHLRGEIAKLAKGA